MSDEDDELIPLIPITYLQRVRELVAKFAAELEDRPGNIYAQRCWVGWKRELERLEEGQIY
jgi:hypothetical protein